MTYVAIVNCFYWCIAGVVVLCLKKRGFKKMFGVGLLSSTNFYLFSVNTN